MKKIRKSQIWHLKNKETYKIVSDIMKALKSAKQDKTTV